MSYYISETIGYYEGDKIDAGDIAVDQRPDPWATWTGGKWVPGSAPIPQSPVEKLKAFLEANPDVAAVLE